MKKYQKIDAEDLHYLKASDRHPANTYFHFSFANFYDPNKMNFGVLRVINDDDVKPDSGFTTHPHDNMEIFSYVIDGKLTHRDSAGNHEILSRGNVQCISAGTGVTHSELNEQADWCRFLQIWITPDERALAVRYDIHKYSSSDRKNKLLQIMTSSKRKDKAPLYVHQDINAYVSELTEKETNVSFLLDGGRQAYVYCFEGSVSIDKYPTLGERDSLKISGHATLDFSLTSEQAHFIIIEMPQD